jgi:uncharacterized protein (TIGR02246 family)
VSKHRRIPIWAGVFAVVMISLARSSSGRAADLAPWGNTVHLSSPREAADGPVRTLVNQMIEAYNRGDVSEASARFAPDGDLIAGDGVVVSTRVGIERFLSDLQAKLPKGTQFLLTITNVRFAAPDVAVVTTEGGWRYPDETEISDKNRGIQSVVVIKQSGTWRVALFQRTRKVATASAQK